MSFSMVAVPHYKTVNNYQVNYEKEKAMPPL
jgi:hypothetical protein